MSELEEILQKALSKQTEELLAAINSTNLKVEKLDREVMKVKKENQEIKRLLAAQAKKTEYLERQIKIKNIIIHGMEEMQPETNEMLEEKVVNLIMEKVRVTMKREEIDKIHRLGQKRGAHPRPVLLTVNTERKKFEIMRNSKNLRGTNIWFHEDLSEKMREERKILKRHMNDAREKGNRAFILSNKLMVNGELYTIQQLELEGEEDVERNITNKEVENAEPISKNAEQAKVETATNEYRTEDSPRAGMVASTSATKNGTKKPESKNTMKQNLRSAVKSRQQGGNMVNM